MWEYCMWWSSYVYREIHVHVIQHKLQPAVFLFRRYVSSMHIFTVRKRSCGKVMFLPLSAILSTGGGVSAPVHARIHTPPGRHPPAQYMLGYMATAADGTHPTGIHSCNIFFSLLAKIYLLVGPLIYGFNFTNQQSNEWYPWGLHISLHIRSPAFSKKGGGYSGVNFGHLKSEVFQNGGGGVFQSKLWSSQIWSFPKWGAGGIPE